MRGNIQDEQQVKSRQRVQTHGEVFTAQREVNAMLDLVKQETVRIDSRFLEPACGEGNFLAEILRRKLVVVERQYKRNPSDYERNALLALSSIYGVELLQDNAAACRQRLFAIMTILLRNASVDEPIYKFLDKKRAEGKPYYVYMTAGANKFLRIYYGKVRDYLAALDASVPTIAEANPYPSC